MRARAAWLGLAGLVWWCAPAFAQLPEGLTEQPALGATTRATQLERRLETLKEQRTDLRDRTAGEVDWRERQKQLDARAEALTDLRGTRLQDTEPTIAQRRWTGLVEPAVPPPDPAVEGPSPQPVKPLLPVIEVVDDGDYQEGYLAPGIHPAELKALDSLIQTIDLGRHRYASLLRLHWEERVQLNQAISDAQALLEQLEVDSAKVDQAATNAVSLAQVEQLALDAHHAHIEQSLARQRVEDAAPAETADPPVPRLPAATPPQAYEPAAAFEASLARAKDMRQEQARLLRELGTLRAPLRTAQRQAEQAKQAARRIEREAVERTARQHDDALRSGLTRLRVTTDDLTLAQAALDKTRTAHTQQIARAQAALEALRLAEPGAAKGDAEADPLSEQRAFRIEKAALTEQIRYAQNQLQRDAFRVALARHLNAIIAGEPAPPVMTDRFGTLLDARASTAQKDDLRVRCDGWRRGRSAVQKTVTEDATTTERKDLMLQGFARLADLCMRAEWVLDTQERLAQIARFHLDRQQVVNRTVWWYAWRILASIAILGLVVLTTRWIGLITHRLARPPGAEEPAPQRTKLAEPTQITWKARLARIRGTAALLLYLALAGSLWFAASALTVEYVWGHPVEWSTWLGWLTHPIMTIADNPVSAWSLMSILMWIVGGLWLARAFQSFLSEGLLDHFAVQRGVRDVVGTLARYLVILLGIIFGLSSAGIPLAALAAVFGVLGIGIGFGLQNIASNFISGFIILVERPFRRGDYIQVGDMVGEVKEIRARATTIETRDAVTVVVPNSEFVTGKVINWTLGHNERLRTQVSVGVAYGSDLQQVTRILLDIGRAHADVLGWPGPRVEMTGFGDSSINFNLHVWTRRLRTLPGLRSDLYLAIDAAFRTAGIDIPFPIRTVLMPDGEAPSEASEEDSSDTP
jgi:small-conductance mechanosensitive channel